MLKSMSKTVIRNLPAFLVLVFLVACLHQPVITGEWVEPGEKSLIEFRQDGTFTATDDMGMTVTGNYILQAEGKIRLEIKHPDSSIEIITGSITVQGDTLKLAHEEDKELLIYKKSK